ncbi:DUF3843 family protein [Flavivirga sp. 57AJ16]|uniref:DUF3843 family protein n=1 Tax=Flavivirga sp. 57AJ16 TaxID=3025307 RepID=UPI002365AC7F|nr:DUF3843 family protein [Flavivirga sp. 57AJ16]MDD7887157.1 DUF3843 family protein [Flavivirga sp. 57AJ16]
MKSKIYLKHWLALKPENYSANTDLYYLKVANNVHSNFIPSSSFMLSQFIEKEDILLLSCFLTCYFEDVISQTNIWYTFKSMYKDLYNKKLPFYIIEDDYIDEEINFEDVAFLTWYFLNTIQQDKFINPYNDFILDIATTTMQIFDDEYEYAPENEKLKKLYAFEDTNVDFYQTRTFLQFVFFESYLFYTDIKLQLDLNVLDIIEENKEEDPSMVMGYIREITEDFTFNTTSSLLALNAKDWAKNLLEKTHSEYERIESISDKIFGLFFYKSQNENNVNIEHIASGMTFEMTKKSFDHYENLDENDILYIGLVKWNKEWWFSGNFSISDFDADVILDQKNSLEARSEVNFLNDPKKIDDILRKKEKAFLSFNNNSPIAFLKANEVETFLSNYISHYIKTLNLSNKQQKEALQRIKDDGYSYNKNNPEDFNSEEEAIIFFNSKKGVEIYFDIINAFPDENNPFFTHEDNDDIMHLLISPDYSVELVLYFVETYKNKLSFFKKEPYKSYLDDLDFLLRFWKKDNYFTKSAITLIDK